MVKYLKDKIICTRNSIGQSTALLMQELWNRTPPGALTNKLKKICQNDLNNIFGTSSNFNNLPKYYKYFDEWISNLTDVQIQYYKILWARL